MADRSTTSQPIHLKENEYYRTAIYEVPNHDPSLPSTKQAVIERISPKMVTTKDGKGGQNSSRRTVMHHNSQAITNASSTMVGSRVVVPRPSAMIQNKCSTSQSLNYHNRNESTCSNFSQAAKLHPAHNVPKDSNPKKTPSTLIGSSSR